MSVENRKAKRIDVGDQMRTVSTVTEKRVTTDKIGLVWDDGNVTWYDPDDAIEIVPAAAPVPDPEAEGS